MYKGRINAWNLHKNLKKAEKATLIRKVRQKRGASPLLFKGRPVPMHRLVRYCKEDRILTGGLEEMVRGEGQRPLALRVDASSCAEPAAHDLQSLFGAPAHPIRPIAIHGDMRTVEIIILNTDIYLNFYFATGPGTRYFIAEETVAGPQNLPGESLVLIKNEDVWAGVMEPSRMNRHISDAMEALHWGYTDSAFQVIEKATSLVQVLLEQQVPTLLAHLFSALVCRTKDHSHIARNVRQFILDMAAIVLGRTHPLSVIISSLCTLSSTRDKLCVWYALTEAFSKRLGALKNSTMLVVIRWSYCYALGEEGLTEEAQEYLEVVFSTKERNEEQKLEYISARAVLLRKQRKYMEAESECRKCLELLKGIEDDILAHRTNLEVTYRRQYLYGCLYGLAYILEAMQRIEEAKAMGWRFLEFSCAAYGPDSVDTAIAGSYHHDFLTRHGYIEESVALRAQYPFLVNRKKLPPESL